MAGNQLRCPCCLRRSDALTSYPPRLVPVPRAKARRGNSWRKRELRCLARMSIMTYSDFVNGADKPLRWLHGEVKTPPFSRAARLEAGLLLRRLQQGESVSLPHSRPLPNIGARCHELRVRDENKNWRIVYRIDEDRILIVDVFKKTTRQTSDAVISVCRRRLTEYDRARRVE